MTEIEKELKLIEFNMFVETNYDSLILSAKKTCKGYTPDEMHDVVHIVYGKIRKYIKKNGFKGSKYDGYYYMALRNEYRLGYNKAKRNKLVFYGESDELFAEVENTLLVLLDKSNSSKDYDYELLDIVENLFKFVNLNFTDDDVYLFKNYFLLERQTYRKISERTGISITEISLRLKSMKKKIRLEFIKWYTENERRR